jgi:hypothetical protein
MATDEADLVSTEYLSKVLCMKVSPHIGGLSRWTAHNTYGLRT